MLRARMTKFDFGVLLADRVIRLSNSGKIAQSIMDTSGLRGGMGTARILSSSLAAWTPGVDHTGSQFRYLPWGRRAFGRPGCAAGFNFFLCSRVYLVVFPVQHRPVGRAAGRPHRASRSAGGPSGADGHCPAPQPPLPTGELRWNPYVFGLDPGARRYRMP